MAPDRGVLRASESAIARYGGQCLTSASRSRAPKQFRSRQLRSLAFELRHEERRSQREAFTPSCCAARSRSKSRAGNIPRRIRKSCATFSASPSAGARRCAVCCGPTRAWSCRSSPASRPSSMHVPCTFDFNVAATKYFNGLADGDIPLCLMFSGTVFYEDAEGSLRVAPISWDKETRFRLPLKIWQDMMDMYYPEHRLAVVSAAMFSSFCTTTKSATASPAGSRPSKKCWCRGRW